MLSLKLLLLFIWRLIRKKQQFDIVENKKEALGLSLELFLLFIWRLIRKKQQFEIVENKKEVLALSRVVVVVYLEVGKQEAIA